MDNESKSEIINLYNLIAAQQTVIFKFMEVIQTAQPELREKFTTMMANQQEINNMARFFLESYKENSSVLKEVMKEKE
jgi:hypothetical protein